MRPPLKLQLAALAVLGVAACGGDPAPLLAELHREFQPGLTVAQAHGLLQARGATASTRSAAECEALVRQARVATQIAPRGGPCVFGKIPVARGGFGAHDDVILQLVFGVDGRLADASFEAIRSYL